MELAIVKTQLLDLNDKFDYFLMMMMKNGSLKVDNDVNTPGYSSRRLRTSMGRNRTGSMIEGQR